MGLVYESSSSGRDVKEVIDTRLMPALTGLPLDLAVGAMCTVMLTQMRDDITEDQLFQGVKGVTGWMVTYLSSLDDAPSDLIVN